MRWRSAQRRMAARKVMAAVWRERTRGVGQRWHGSGPCLAAQSRVTSPQQLAARAYLVHLRERALATIMYTISIFCYVEVFMLKDSFSCSQDTTYKIYLKEAPHIMSTLACSREMHSANFYLFCRFIHKAYWFRFR